ncbi:MAG: DHHA1 domain-containing protein [Nitrospinota bacterium]|nr:DHHA1 domain-containing protein [Nitrospinota bacterium]
MIIIHHDDYDGRCSAALVKLKHPGARLHAIDYKDNFPIQSIADKEEVWLLDYCPQGALELDFLLAKTYNVTWIDHHNTAHLKKLPGFHVLQRRAVSRDTSKSAALLTWEHLYPDAEAPQFVQLINDFDLFKFAYGEATTHFIAGISAEDTAADSPLWGKLMNDDYLFKKIIHNGKIINRASVMAGSEYLGRWGYETVFENHISIACNMGRPVNDLFAGVRNKYPVMIAYAYDGEKYSVSLYTTDPDIDVSEIAAKYGGGGHRGAAGFICAELPFKKFQIQYN